MSKILFSDQAISTKYFSGFVTAFLQRIDAIDNEMKSGNINDRMMVRPLLSYQCLNFFLMIILFIFGGRMKYEICL